MFEASLRLLSPFMPFITEEIWHAVYDGNPPAKSIALGRYPARSQLGETNYDPYLFGRMQSVQNLVSDVRNGRKEKGIPEKEVVPIAVYAFRDYVRQTFTENQDVIQKLARVSNIEFSDTELRGPDVIRLLNNYAVQIMFQVPERTIDIPAERERLTKDIAKYEKGLAAAERQLGNDGFLAKAPANVVEGLKKQQAETKLLLYKAQVALNELPKS